MSSSRLLGALFVLVCATACSESDSGGGASGSAGAAGSDASLPDASGGSAGSDGSVAAPYSVPAFDAVRIGSDPNGPNFQRATASIDFGAGPFASAKLVVELDTTCYPFDGWQNNPPPAGHNWPASSPSRSRPGPMLRVR